MKPGEAVSAKLSDHKSVNHPKISPNLETRWQTQVSGVIRSARLPLSLFFDVSVLDYWIKQLENAERLRKARKTFSFHFRIFVKLLYALVRALFNGTWQREGIRPT